MKSGGPTDPYFMVKAMAMKKAQERAAELEKEGKKNAD